MHSELKIVRCCARAILGGVGCPRRRVLGGASGGATAPGGSTDVDITKGRLTAALRELRGCLD